MTLLSAIFLSFLIYIILVIPIIVGVFLMYYVSKKMEVGNVTIKNTLKLVGFYFLSISIFIAIFSMFTVRPFANFSKINNNGYVSIFILFILLAVSLFFIFLHFKVFSLFAKNIYSVVSAKNIFLYLSTGMTVYFLIFFYVPALQIFLHYTQISLAR